MTKLHFKVHASVIYKLGESLIADEVTALSELLKNAYDADASFCKLMIDPDYVENGAQGQITITDNGCGMDLQTIVSGWLTISNSPKKRMKNNNKRRVPEDYQPEINLDEHPDAPRLYISVLTALHIDQLRDRAREQGIPEDVILDSRKPELIARMLRLHSANGGALLVEGVLEILQEGSFGYIRYGVNNYLAGSEDVYVSASLIKSIGMKTGDTVFAQIRAPRENEKSAAVVRVLVPVVVPAVAQFFIQFRLQAILHKFGNGFLKQILDVIHTADICHLQ